MGERKNTRSTPTIEEISDTRQSQILTSSVAPDQHDSSQGERVREEVENSVSDKNIHIQDQIFTQSAEINSNSDPHVEKIKKSNTIMVEKVKKLIVENIKISTNISSQKALEENSEQSTNSNSARKSEDQGKTSKNKNKVIKSIDKHHYEFKKK